MSRLGWTRHRTITGMPLQPVLHHIGTAGMAITRAVTRRAAATPRDAYQLVLRLLALVFLVLAFYTISRFAGLLATALAFLAAEHAISDGP